MKYILIAIIFITALLYADYRTNKIMSVEYCWNSDGEHFLLGDDRCKS